MFYFLQISLNILAIYLFLNILGWGLARILLQSRREWIIPFAPWLGAVLIAVIYSFNALLGYGLEERIWIGMLMSTSLLIISLWKTPSFFKQEIKRLGLSTFLLFIYSLFLATPQLLCKTKGILISIGNGDPYSYSLAAERFKEDGAKKYIYDLKRLNDSSWARSNLTYNNTIVEVGYNPRWLATLTLAYFSSLMNQPAAELFFIVFSVFLGLLLPLIYIFATQILDLKGGSILLSLAVCGMNPNLLYIFYHGFLPQILGTGFFLAFIITIPDFFKSEPPHWRVFILTLLSGIGILMSYLEFVPYLFCFLLLYLLFLRIPLKEKLLKVCLLCLGWGLIAPYQTWRLIGFLSMHVDGIRTGWNVTNNYFFLPFLLGFHFSHPAHPHPHLIVEIILGPILLFLFLYGIYNIEKKTFLLSLLLPFFLIALFTYFMDYNYAYYKNWTYFYYLPLLLVVHGFKNLFEYWRTNNSFRKLIVLFGVIIFVFPLTKTLELISFSVRKGSFIEPGILQLDKLRKNKLINNIFIDLSDPWNSLWSTYYLRDKEFALPKPTVDEFIHNQKTIGTIKDNKFKFLLTDIWRISSKTDLNQRPKKLYLKSDDFALYQFI